MIDKGPFHLLAKARVWSSLGPWHWTLQLGGRIRVNFGRLIWLPSSPSDTLLHRACMLPSGGHGPSPRRLAPSGRLRGVFLPPGWPSRSAEMRSCGRSQMFQHCTGSASELTSPTRSINIFNAANGISVTTLPYLTFLALYSPHLKGDSWAFHLNSQCAVDIFSLLGTRPSL